MISVSDLTEVLMILCLAPLTTSTSLSLLKAVPLAKPGTWLPRSTHIRTHTYAHTHSHTHPTHTNSHHIYTLPYTQTHAHADCHAVLDVSFVLQVLDQDANAGSGSGSTFHDASCHVVGPCVSRQDSVSSRCPAAPAASVPPLSN